MVVRPLHSERFDRPHIDQMPEVIAEREIRIELRFALAVECEEVDQHWFLNVRSALLDYRLPFQPGNLVDGDKTSDHKENTGNAANYK
jgi:hypothetical protein